MKKQNEKQAEAMLRMLIDNNFTTNDCYITLTYKGTAQRHGEDAKKRYSEFYQTAQT